MLSEMRLMMAQAVVTAAGRRQEAAPQPVAEAQSAGDLLGVCLTPVFLRMKHREPGIEVVLRLIGSAKPRGCTRQAGEYIMNSRL
jgi:hypothetical protein